jgi:hypothetical protein
LANSACKAGYASHLIATVRVVLLWIDSIVDASPCHFLSELGVNEFVSLFQRRWEYLQHSFAAARRKKKLRANSNKKVHRKFYFTSCTSLLVTLTAARFAEAELTGLSVGEATRPVDFVDDGPEIRVLLRVGNVGSRRSVGVGRFVHCKNALVWFGQKNESAVAHAQLEKRASMLHSTLQRPAFPPAERSNKLWRLANGARSRVQRSTSPSQVREERENLLQNFTLRALTNLSSVGALGGDKAFKLSNLLNRIMVSSSQSVRAFGKSESWGKPRQKTMGMIYKMMGECTQNI